MLCSAEMNVEAVNITGESEFRGRVTVNQVGSRAVADSDVNNQIKTKKKDHTNEAKPGQMRRSGKSIQPQAHLSVHHGDDDKQNKEPPDDSKKTKAPHAEKIVPAPKAPSKAGKKEGGEVEPSRLGKSGEVEPPRPKNKPVDGQGKNEKGCEVEP